MAGLINQAMPSEAPQQMAPQQMAPQQEQPATQEQATAQSSGGNDKEAFKIISGQMINLMYDSSEAIVEDVRSGGPKQMVDTLARIMVMSINSLKMVGKKADPKVMLVSMTQLTKALAEVLIKAGVIEEDPRLIEESFFAAISKADDELQNEALTPQEREEYVAIMQAIRQMQQQSAGNQGGDQAQPQEMQTGGVV